MLASPKFLGYTKDAKLAQVKNDVRAVESAIEIELVKAEVDKLEEWNWSTIEADKMKKYVDEGSLLDRKGTVGELEQDEFHAVDEGDVSVKSKLKGNFIYAKGGKMFCQDNGVSGSEEGAEDETAKGYFHYVGEADKAVILHEVMGNEVRNYYRMFYNDEHETMKFGKVAGDNGVKVTVVVSTNENVTSMDFMFSRSKATTGYARAQNEADHFNGTENVPLVFTAK